MRPLVRSITLTLTLAACHGASGGDDGDPRAPADRGARATATIAGTSISDVLGSDVDEALSTAGWRPGGAVLNVAGPMETLTAIGDKGALHATISVVRPRRSPGATSAHAASAREQEAYYSTYAATLLDDPVMVAVAIKGSKDEAAKLLDILVHR